MKYHLWPARAAGLAALGMLTSFSSAAWGQERPLGGVRQLIVTRAADEAEKGDDGEQVKLPDYWIGVMCNPVSPEVRAQLNVPEDQGLIVGQILDDSPAAKAGLKQHDILLSAQGKELKHPKDLVDVVGDAKDNEIEIKVLRQGKEETVKVKPEKRPENARGPEPNEQGDFLYRFFGENDGDHPIRMRFIHPGMVFPPTGLKHELPEDVRVEITKEGKKPAKIAVHRGDKSWNVTEDNLKELPEDLRPHIAALSGNMPMPGGPNFNMRVPGPGDGQPGFRAFGGGPGQDRVEQRLEEMSRRMRELREDLDRMREDRPRRERPAPRARGDESEERRRPEPPPRPGFREDDRREERRGDARRGEDRRDRERDADERDDDKPRKSDA